MTKQQVLDQLRAENSDAESLHDLEAIVNQYPDDMDNETFTRLIEEVEQYAADSEMLAKAYSDLADGMDDYAEQMTTVAEDSLQQVAKDAHRDFSYAQSMLDE